MSQPSSSRSPRRVESSPLIGGSVTTGSSQSRSTGKQSPKSAAARAKHVVTSGLDSARVGLVEGQHRIRHLFGSRHKQTAVSQRPDGTPVAPSPAPIRAGAPSGGLVERIVAPVRAVEVAVKDRWGDAMREAKLAARAKETDMRADYERLVHHDARLHAEQHNKRQDGG